ncbi:MAG: 3-oxo-5-alpha-steroid 4-dehydrogenase [Spirochaetales bacterium]|nr:3-oxo-5-alpha-steroid 4-dehydrogenase [Spirochaetales bacterium]
MIDSLYRILLITQFSLVLPVLGLLFFIRAPYGKFGSSGSRVFVWDSRMAWMVMELPAAATIFILYLYSPARQEGSLNLIFLLIWEFHYLYRTFLFPLLMKGNSRNFPALIVLSAWFFNGMNGFINGYYLFYIRPAVEASFFRSPRFLTGLLIFLAGFSIHCFSDAVIRTLRRNKGPGYHIPHGGLYKLVSSPAYLGEWIQWSGWALLTWSLPGLAFSLFTFANLYPRAVANHKWYLESFPDYPDNRTAFFPAVLKNRKNHI